MKKTIVLAVLLFNLPSYARQRYEFWCEQGGQKVVTSNVSSATNVQRSYVGCTATVYLTGTLTLATLYSNNSGTAQANPFTSSIVNGLGYFYADNGRYDLTLSGSGIAAPFTIGDILLADPASFSTGVLSFNARTGAVLPATGDYSFADISGNITTHTHASSSQGGQLVLGTIFATQSANTFAAGPASGSAAAPTWRVMVAADLATHTHASSVQGGLLGATAFNTQSANVILAGPTSGGAATPTFRALVAADLPSGTGGSVNSVAMTGDNVIFSSTVTGSPVTTSGTLVPTLKTQVKNRLLAGPGTGADATPTFRVLVSDDIPNNAADTSGNAATATALAANPANCAAGTLPRGIDASGTAEGCAAVNLAAGADVTGALPTANLVAASLIRSCEIIIGDPGAATVALANDNDRPVVCSNDTGQTLTITAVKCYADAGTPTVTPIITGGAATSILTGACTCGTAVYGNCTLNGTPTQGATTIDGNITVAGGTAKYIVMRIVRTL